MYTHEVSRNLDRIEQNIRAREVQRANKEHDQQIVTQWLATSKAKQLFVQGQLQPEDAVFIRDFLQKYQGTPTYNFSLESTLNAAADEILRMRQKDEEERQRELELCDQIEAYLREHKISMDDQTLEVIDNLRKQPNFSYDSFVRFCEMYPEKFNQLQGFKPFNLVDVVRHASPVELARLRARYGNDRVDQALQTLAKRIHKGVQHNYNERQVEGLASPNTQYTAEDEAADKARRQADLEKSPIYKLQQNILKRECENIIFRFRMCLDGDRTDHAATQDGREELQHVYDAGVAAQKPWAELRTELETRANELAGIA